jgi:Fe-S cluster assembly protein SufD
VNAALLDEFGIGDAREREESWRYSKLALRALSQQAFVPAAASAVLAPEAIARFDWPATRGRRLVFVNGTFVPAHSDSSRIGPGITIRQESANRLVLEVTGEMADPLHLVHAASAGNAPGRWNGSIEIHVRSGRANIVEQHLGAEGADVLGALSMRIVVAPDAQADVISLSDLTDSTSLYRRVEASVAERGAYRSTQAIFGGRLQRLELRVALTGDAARFESRGLFALRARQHADTQLDVRHAARDTSCDVVWRGVADQRARGILRGAITVAAGADGADARLQTKNLLLSPHAEIDAQPVLEIHADEVKAAHGATVGQLDEVALFYLRSRGLPAVQARTLLIAGFCREALAGIGDAAIGERLDAVLSGRLPQAAEAGA